MSKLFVFAESFYAFKVSYSGLRELAARASLPPLLPRVYVHAASPGTFS